MDRDKTESDKTVNIKNEKNWKRPVIEWGLLILFAVTLYATGYHTQVIGMAQRGLLATGLIKPTFTVDDDQMRDAGTEFYFADESYKTNSIAIYRGKVVFLNIWASWCPPCIAEMPSIASLYADFKNDDEVKFLLISVDEDFEDAKKFVESRELDLPIYHYRGKDPDVFDSKVVPTTYVITPSGKIAMEKQGMAAYYSPEFAEFLIKLKEM